MLANSWCCPVLSTHPSAAPLDHSPWHARHRAPAESLVVLAASHSTESPTSYPASPITLTDAVNTCVEESPDDLSCGVHGHHAGCVYNITCQEDCNTEHFHCPDYTVDNEACQCYFWRNCLEGCSSFLDTWCHDRQTPQCEEHHQKRQVEAICNAVGADLSGTCAATGFRLGCGWAAAMDGETCRSRCSEAYPGCWRNSNPSRWQNCVNGCVQQ